MAALARLAQMGLMNFVGRAVEEVAVKIVGQAE
jgi:hypothetical protein